MANLKNTLLTLCLFLLFVSLKASGFAGIVTAVIEAAPDPGQDDLCQPKN